MVTGDKELLLPSAYITKDRV